MSTHRLAIGAFVAGLWLLAVTTDGCGAGEASAGGNDAAAGTTDASGAAAAGDASSPDVRGSAGSGGAATAGTDGGAGATATGGAGGSAAGGAATCETTCVKADACCNAVSVTYDNGLDRCAYKQMCDEAQGGTKGLCAKYLEMLPDLLFSDMPLPEACK